MDNVVRAWEVDDADGDAWVAGRDDEDGDSTDYTVAEEAVVVVDVSSFDVDILIGWPQMQPQPKAKERVLCVRAEKESCEMQCRFGFK